MFALFLKFALGLVPRIFGLFSSLKPDSKSSYEPKGIGIGLRTRASPFNRANVKRHLIWSRYLNIAWPLSRRDMFMIYILCLLIIYRPSVKGKIPSFFLTKFGEFLGSSGTVNPRTYKGGSQPPVRFF